MGNVLQLSEEECEQRMKEFPLWELAPDSRSISRTFVAKNFAEGELMLVSYCAIVAWKFCLIHLGSFTNVSQLGRKSMLPLEVLCGWIIHTDQHFEHAANPICSWWQRLHDLFLVAQCVP